MISLNLFQQKEQNPAKVEGTESLAISSESMETVQSLQHFAKQSQIIGARYVIDCA